MLLEKIQLSEYNVNESVFLLPLLSAETSLLISLLFMSELLYEIYQKMKTRNVRGAAETINVLFHSRQFRYVMT